MIFSCLVDKQRNWQLQCVWKDGASPHPKCFDELLSAFETGDIPLDVFDSGEQALKDLGFDVDDADVNDAETSLHTEFSYQSALVRTGFLQPSKCLVNGHLICEEGKNELALCLTVPNFDTSTAADLSVDSAAASQLHLEF